MKRFNKSKQNNKYQRRCHGKSQPVWWRSVCSRSTAAVIVLIFLYIFASSEYIKHWAWFSDVEHKGTGESTKVYIAAFRVLTIVLGYLLLVSGIQSDVTSDSLQLASVAQIEVESDLLDPGEYSETTRLAKSLYRGNCALQRAKVDRRELDVNLRNFIEALIPSEIISEINATLTNNLQQSRSTVNVWRSWFRSRFMREAWRSDRAFYSRDIVRFIEQMLLPEKTGQPRPKAPWCVYVFRNPLTVINAIVFLLVVVGSLVWFLWFGPRTYATLNQSVALFIDAMEGFFLAAVILLLTYEVGRKSRSAQVVEDQLEVDSQEEFVRSHYPESVRFYKQLYPNDKRLDKVYVPPETNKNKEILFNAAYARVLLTDAQITLKLTPEPGPEAYRLWRSWFSSPILREQYVENRRMGFLERHTIEVFETKVLPCTTVSLKEEEEEEEGQQQEEAENTEDDNY